MKKYMVRCNSAFFGRPRYDHILLHTEDRNDIQLAQIILCFQVTWQANNQAVAVPVPLAYVLRYELVDRSTDTNLLRFRKLRNNPYQVIPAASIMRNAAITADPKSSALVHLDEIDCDMLLRSISVLNR